MNNLIKLLITLNFRELFMTPSDDFFIQAFRYLFVGGFAFVADAGLLFIWSFSRLNDILGAAVAFIVGLIVNYILATKFVFSPNEKIAWFAEFLIYGVIGGIGLLMTVGLIYLLTEMMNIHLMLAKVFVTAVVLVWNFFARKLLLYRT